MPSFVVKAAPDEDLYAIYSTIVDAFVFIGTRGETRQRLLYEDGINGRPDERMERADLNGTSSRIGGPVPELPPARGAYTNACNRCGQGDGWHYRKDRTA